MARRPKAATKPGSDRVTEEDVNAAVSIIQRDYYQDVRDLGDSLKDEIKSGDIADAEQLEERINQDVDGSARVIYTFQAKLGMLVTDNDEAYEDFGFENPTVEQKMYCAMVADVRDYLGDFDDLFTGEEDED